MPVKLELSKTAQKVVDNLCKNRLDYLEKARFKYLNRYNNRAILNLRLNIPLLCMVIFADIFIKGPHVGVAAYSIVPLLFLGFSRLPVYTYRRKYKRNFVKGFVPKFFKELFNYTYTGKKDILERKIENFRLLGDFHTYKAEDHLHGETKEGIKLDFEEAEIYTDHTKFKGGVILLEKPSFVEKRIVIKAKNVYRDSNGVTNGLEKLAVSDKTFAKYFDVYSADIKYAEKVITPKLMKKMVETSKKLHDLFNAEFLSVSSQYKHEMAGYKNTTDHKMSTGCLEIEFFADKVLMLLRGQYNFLAPANLETSVYCNQRLSVIEQEFKAIESIAKVIAKGE